MLLHRALKRPMKQGRPGANIESEYLGRGLRYVESQAEGYATKYPICKI